MDKQHEPENRESFSVKRKVADKPTSRRRMKPTRRRVAETTRRRETN